MHRLTAIKKSTHRFEGWVVRTRTLWSTEIKPIFLSLYLKVVFPANEHGDMNGSDYTGRLKRT